MRVSPPTHTHTQTLGIHVRLSAPGFGVHRICACADPNFHFFSSAYFTEGPICLGPLSVSFFERKTIVLVSIALWEAHTWCAKVCFKGCGYPGCEIVWNTCWLVCGWAWSDMVLWRFGVLPRTVLYCTENVAGIHACIRGRGQGSLDPPENSRYSIPLQYWSSEESQSCQFSIKCWAIIGSPPNSMAFRWWPDVVTLTVSPVKKVKVGPLCQNIMPPTQVLRLNTPTPKAS